MTDVVCVIPCFNEEETVGEVIEGVRSQDLDLDVVVVDDSSTDSTKGIAEEKGVEVIRHPVNLGAGAAVQTGCKYAVRNEYEYVLTVDGDGQHSPESIPGLFSKFCGSRADVCIGSRFKAEDYYEMSVLRALGNRFFSLLVSSTASIEVTDVTSGFRAFSREVAELYALNNTFPNDIWAVEVTYSTLREGFEIAEYPVEMSARRSGESHLKSHDFLKYPFLALYGAISSL